MFDPSHAGQAGFRDTHNIIDKVLGVRSHTIWIGHDHFQFEVG